MSIAGWTDEQDAIAYDTFATLANTHGAAEAERIMTTISTDFGADFAPRDVQAWAARYRDEQPVTVYRAWAHDQVGDTARLIPVSVTFPTEAAADGWAQFLNRTYEIQAEEQD